MATYMTCGFCHEMVRMGVAFCPECGHEPHVSRFFCCCPRCRPSAPARPIGAPPPPSDLWRWATDADQE